MKVPEKDCKSYKEAEEYLNSLGIYIWHKKDDPEYIKYLLNLGCYVYIATGYGHRSYFLLYKVRENDFNIERFNILATRVSERPNKLIKFIRKGFFNYVYYLGVYDI